MRTLIVAAAALSLLVGCAAQEPQQRPQPPPPSHPVIEGNVKSVSAADVRQILAFMRTHIIKEHGSFVPIYSIYIIDRNSATGHWWDNGFETVTPIDRVNGKWQLSNTSVERILKMGVNIPTS